MYNDLRYGVRMLRKRPGFTAVAVLTLAIGIGVNANIFGMVNAFFFQPLPVPDAGRLVMVLQRSQAWGLPHGHSWPDYEDYRARNTVFSDLAAMLPMAVHLSAAGQPPERTWIELVSPNYFALAGVPAALGRVFDPEGADAGQPVMVLNHDYWQRRFGGDPSIVGQSITLNGRSFNVIGVTPASFKGLEWAMSLSAFVPAPMVPQIMNGARDLIESRAAPAWRLMGRLKPESNLAQARAEIQLLAAQLEREFPEAHKESKVLVLPEKRCRPDPTFADFMPVFGVVFGGMVALVLFIACANVANLMFARALQRQKEMAMRAALGAGRWRMIRQVLVETVLLGLIAGAVGYGLAEWAGQFIVRLMPPSDIPVNTDHPADWRQYAFTLAISLVAGIATGLAPALKACRFDLVATLKATPAGRFGGGRHPFRNLLVVGQVTLSLVVLICGGLFVHSLERARDLALGFRPDRLLTASMDLGLQQYEDEAGRQFVRRLLEEVRVLPGVESASCARQVPFDFSVLLSDVAPEGGQVASADGFASVSYTMIEQEYLRVAGIPLLRGREFTERDRPDSPAVAIVNETFAGQFWPGQEPLGKRFRYGREGRWFEVVGVAADSKYVFLAEEPRSFFYLPLAQEYTSPLTLVVRTRTEPTAMVEPVRQIVRRLDSHLPIYNLRTMEEHISGSVFALLPLRVGAILAGVQGAIGLLLAVMGIYAVVAYAVSQRTQEIGIRMALGARAVDVVRLVVREGMKLTCIGVGIGLVLAAGLGFALSRVLYGVRPLDPVVFVGVTFLLVGVAALACYWPARRATRLDPVVALRSE